MASQLPSNSGRIPPPPLNRPSRSRNGSRRRSSSSRYRRSASSITERTVVRLWTASRRAPSSSGSAISIVVFIRQRPSSCAGPSCAVGLVAGVAASAEDQAQALLDDRVDRGAVLLGDLPHLGQQGVVNLEIHIHTAHHTALPICMGSDFTSGRGPSRWWRSRGRCRRRRDRK